MKKTAIITGGAGFIGSSLAGRLLDEGHNVFILDNLSTGLMSNIPKGAEFIYFDISNQNHYYKLDRINADVVFHIAGQSSGEISFENPLNDFDINTKGTILLLDFLKNRNIERVFYTSSMSVYGNKMRGVFENDIPEPESYYGISKMASEAYISIYAKDHGICYTIFRLFNVYGPMQNIANMKQGMISIYMAYLLSNHPVVVKGSLDRYRDFIYIDDAVNCFLKCLDEENSKNKIYNVASGKKTTVKEVLNSMFSIAGMGDYPVEIEEATKGDTFGIFADIKKICQEVGWKPVIPLEAGLARMYKHYTKNYGGEK